MMFEACYSWVHRDPKSLCLLGALCTLDGCVCYGSLLLCGGRLGKIVWVWSTPSRRPHCTGLVNALKTTS